MVADKKQKLRFGYTTGACATAATKAALIALITDEPQLEATIFIPAGKFVTFEMKEFVISKMSVRAGTIKDGGDDPDATHGALIQATVSWNTSDDVCIDGGHGVGRITKKGLPIEVGLAAINPIPRTMIYEIAKQVLNEYNISRGIDVVISVPGGEEIAKKTLNPRLGIVGGISILGTRGIVVPFSNVAYEESITQAISVAKASNCDHLVITTGGRSEKYGMKLYPSLPEEAFIEMGDFVGYTLKECQKYKIKKITIVGMIGKLSKLAYGAMNVHSKNSKVDFQFLADIASSVNASEELIAEIKVANTALQVGELMIENNHDDFFEKLTENCCLTSLNKISGGIVIETCLFTLNGTLLGRAVKE